MKHPQHNTLLGYLDRLKPFVCRILARKGPKRWQVPSSTNDISKESGLDRKCVIRISKLETWAGVPVRIVDAFRAACGITPQNERLHVAYLKAQRKKANPFPYLARVKGSETRRMIRELTEI